MSDDLIFEEPPAANPGRPSPIPAWLAALRENPGKWAKFPKRVAPSTAPHINGGRYAGIAAGDFEAVVRNVGGTPRNCDMYTRYVGGES